MKLPKAVEVRVRATNQKRLIVHKNASLHEISGGVGDRVSFNHFHEAGPSSTIHTQHLNQTWIGWVVARSTNLTRQCASSSSQKKQTVQVHVGTLGIYQFTNWKWFTPNQHYCCIHQAKSNVPFQTVPMIVDCFSTALYTNQIWFQFQD